jgi:hypothetical protein
MVCVYLSTNPTETMINTTANATSLENLNRVATIGSVLALIYFLAAIVAAIGSVLASIYFLVANLLF